MAQGVTHLQPRHGRLHSPLAERKFWRGLLGNNFTDRVRLFLEWRGLIAHTRVVDDRCSLPSGDTTPTFDPSLPVCLGIQTAASQHSGLCPSHRLG
jgi:hypothetical protein